MIIIVSVMLLIMKACCKKLKLLHCQYITKNSESITYIGGPLSEEKNPPSSGSAYRLGLEWPKYGIIELVDSICRDSADTQYMIILESIDSICRDSIDTQYSYYANTKNSSKSPKQLTYKPL